jgi:hypothetical protein
MNDERDNTDMERLVSESYREVATEQAPARLNEQILRMATGKAAIPQQRSAYAFAAAWLRPAAWAATIGLSLVIVLEITQEPIVRPAPLAATSATPAEDAVAGRLEEAQTKVDFEAESPRMDEPPTTVVAPPKRQVVASESASKPLDSRSDVAYGTTDEAYSTTDEAYNTTDEAYTTSDASKSLANAPANEQFKPRARDTLREAETQALLRSSASLQQEEFALASAMEKKESDAPGSCDNESRETAESWYACIMALRESGFTDDADSEHDEFILKFPDFEPKR